MTDHPPRDVAILTGATGGLGQAFAKALLPRCRVLLLMSRQADKLQALQHTLQKEARQQNLSTQVHSLVGDGSSATTHKAMQQCQALLPALRAAPQAQLVLVGSMLAYIGYRGNAAYCASKFGLRGYAQALHRELASSHVRVKFFAPRAVDTAINTDAVRALQRALGTQADTPEHVAGHLMRCLQGRAHEYKIGFPERLYAWLNQLCPKIIDGALAKQLPIIEHHYPAPTLHSPKEPS